MKFLSKFFYICIIIFILTLNRIKSEFNTGLFDITDPEKDSESLDYVMGGDEEETNESFTTETETEDEKNTKREVLYNFENYDEAKYLIYPQRAYSPNRKTSDDEKIDYNDVDYNILRDLYKEINLLNKDMVDKDTFRVLCFKFLTEKNNSDTLQENYFYALICEEIIFDTSPVIHITELHDHLFGDRFYEAMKKVMMQQLGEEEGLEEFNNIMVDVYKQKDLEQKNKESLEKFKRQIRMTEEEKRDSNIYEKMRQIANANATEFKQQIEKTEEEKRDSDIYEKIRQITSANATEFEHKNSLELNDIESQEIVLENSDEDELVDDNYLNDTGKVYKDDL